MTRGRLAFGGSSQGWLITKLRRTGQSRDQPEYTSSMVLPPVMTIFPEKKQSSTTGDDSGL